MSYEPSHRKPPRQERWPNATPGEGWPAYQQHGDGERSRVSADALAGNRNGYATASNGYGDAFAGRADAWGGRTATAEYAGTWDGRGARYDEPADGYRADGYRADGYRAGGDGYGTTTTAWPGAGDGYADGFDGATDGYGSGGYGSGGYGSGGYGSGGYGSGGYGSGDYGSGGYAADGYGSRGYAADEFASGGYAAGEYGQAQDYYQAERGWDEYVQPGHEFTAPVGYQEQDEYPALKPGTTSVLVAPDTLGEWWQRPAAGTRRELSRGLVVGALTGILAAAVAIGVATLAAAFVRPQASPASVLGNIFVDRIPAALKHSVMAHFGAHDRTVLLLGMYVALGLIAMVLGCTARRNPSVGVAGIASFGLLAAFIVITRPESRASDVIPSAAGAVAGVMALLWLACASAPAAEPQPASSGGRRRTR